MCWEKELLEIVHELSSIAVVVHVLDKKLVQDLVVLLISRSIVVNIGGLSLPGHSYMRVEWITETEAQSCCCVVNFGGRIDR